MAKVDMSIRKRERNRMKQKLSRKCAAVMSLYGGTQRDVAEYCEVTEAQFSTYITGKNIPCTRDDFIRIMGKLDELLAEAGPITSPKQEELPLEPPKKRPEDIDTKGILEDAMARVGKVEDETGWKRVAPIPGDINPAPQVSLDDPWTEQIGGAHYKDCKIQPAFYSHSNKLGFLEGCIVKRITRHDKPTGKGKEDLEKIIHEARLLIQMNYGEG